MRQKERKHYTDDCLEDEEIEGRRMFSVEEKLMSPKFKLDFVKEMVGSEFSLKYFQEKSFTHPIVFKEKPGLGIRVPTQNFTVNDVRQCVGRVNDGLPTEDYSNILSLVDLILSLPVQSAECERVFSNMKLVKSDWRSVLKSKNLSDQLMVILATNDIDQYDPLPAIRLWNSAGSKPRRPCTAPYGVRSCNADLESDNECNRSRRVIDVMDTETQTDTQMSMKEWCKYYENKEQRTRLLNVISLEFSHTRLENYVESPTVVRQVDWSDMVWPRFLKDSQVESTNRIEDMKYPKVQKYCLMSVKGCYTDFHVDFGGTSVWYHILHGQKVFWLIPPTDKNLNLYEQWVLSGKQGDVFFGDQVEKCARVKLEAGYTFLIPSGWIHAVYTPEDSLVFGGNFLHSFCAANQLWISAIEDATHVQQKFRYPFFTEMHWYLLQRYVYCLTGKWHLTCNEDGEASSKSGKKHLKVEKEEQASEESDNSITPPNSPKEFKESSFRESDDKENIKDGKKPYVHLTKYELNSLKTVIKWLQSHQRGKKCVPDLIKDADALLKDAKDLVEQHECDDPQSAITGKPVLYWNESNKRKFKPRGHFSMGKPQPTTKSSSGNSSNVRRRRTRCKKCDACLRNDCAECHFCKDMRKFGGPGRMKQSCIARQCMAPVLPHTASCLLCGKDGCQKGNENEPESTSLMECSQCWEILHPECINVKYPGIEGNVNEDLPNSWECPKCVQKTEETGSSGAVKPRSMKKYKSIAEIPSASRPDSMDESSSNSVDQPVHEHLKEHNQNYGENKYLVGSSSLKRKCDDSDYKKKLKVEKNENGTESTVRSVSLLKASKKCDENLDGSFESNDKISSKSGDTETGLPSSHVRSCARNSNIRSVPVTLKNGVSANVSSKLKTVKNGTNNGRSSRLSMMNSRERLVRRMKGLKKSSSELVLRKSVNGVRTANRQIKHLPNAVKNGNPSPQETSSTGISSHPTPRIPIKAEKSRDNSPSKVTPSNSKKSSPNSKCISKNVKEVEQDGNIESEEEYEDIQEFKKENNTNTNDCPAAVKDESQNSPSPSVAASRLGLRDRSTIKRPRFVVRPAPIIEDVEKKSGRNRHSRKYCMDKTVMLNVLKYLSVADLFHCQIVCKTWNSWCVDPVLWKKMNVSRRKLTNMHLMGIVRRQPISLDLGWTNISRKQLSWLIPRFPQIRSLSLAGCSWAAVSALCSADCPLLSSLDLNWVEGLSDSTIRDILSKPPSCTVRPGFIENKTRFRNLIEIKLAGADISDVSVRLLVQNLSLLSSFSISQCRKITDMGIAVLATAKALKLNKVDVSGCINVSDTSLESLKRCVNLTYLDMRECSQVSLTACQRFISQNRSKFLMKEARFFTKNA
ncbi:Lysine-specific demethylase 2B [Nymphon striatum]|nr:Lysine-specific demethylase 2B [Nymphon striatum]